MGTGQREIKHVFSVMRKLACDAARVVAGAGFLFVTTLCDSRFADLAKYGGTY